MTTAAPQAPCTCDKGLVVIPTPDGPWVSACTNKDCKEAQR